MRSRFAVVLSLALTSFLLCGATAPEGCQPQPQPSFAGPIAAGAAIAGGVALGTVILIEVHNSHHTVKGCVTGGPNGLQVRNESDMETYTLTGASASTRVGDRVRLHGSKDKKPKDSTADRTFVVEKMTRDYGPCKLAVAPHASAPSPVGTE